MDGPHLAINAQHFGHFFREVGAAALQIVAYFVRLHVFLVEDFAHRALHQVGEARMSLPRSMLAGVGGEKPCRPQFVRIAAVLGLATGQIDESCLGTSIGVVGSRPGRGIIGRRQLGQAQSCCEWVWQERTYDWLRITRQPSWLKYT